MGTDDQHHSQPRSIADVAGLLVGHAQDDAALTGCTVVLVPQGAVGSVDVRGGGPATRETALLNPASTVSEVHAIALCGGSAFGLGAASGVVDWLHERGYGYATRIAPVPLVPAACIFDLGIGRADRWPDAAMAYAACNAATSAHPAEGCVGAGTGATVGKVLGGAAAMKSGLGTWSETLPDGTVVGALAVCNAFGDVWRDCGQGQGQIIAGARDLERGGFADTMRLLRQEHVLRSFTQRRSQPPQAGEHTTLGLVATSARLSKTETYLLARMAQDALPRTIRPVHTPFDGDAVFALSVDNQPAPHMTILGSIAADVLATAIQRAVAEARSAGGLPAARDRSDQM